MLIYYFFTFLCNHKEKTCIKKNRELAGQEKRKRKTVIKYIEDSTSTFNSSYLSSPNL